MGLFDKLLQKKVCDLCGKEIRLLGNRKLEDGNLCKDCADKLSPWFSDRRNSTVEEIRSQLVYRENNREAVRSFRAAERFGELLIDTERHQFLVARKKDLEEENPDVISCADFLDGSLTFTEYRTEETYRDKEGKAQSYSPPHYLYKCSFYMELQVRNPFFDTIKLPLGSGNETIRYQGKLGLLSGSPVKNSAEYMRHERKVHEIRDALLREKDALLGGQHTHAAAPAANQDAWVCACGTRNTGKFCAECGEKKPEGPIAFCCDKCGWTLEEGKPIPQTCPRCGDPIDEDDIA